MHQHHVGAHFFQYVAHSCEDTGGHVVQILPLPHDVEVVIGPDVKQAEHLVQHLAVLPRNANDGFKLVGASSELLY